MRISLVWRGDPHAAEQPVGRNNLLQPLFDAFESLDVEPQPVVFDEEVVEDVRDQLLRCDGALVWVNPIQDGRDRSVLNAVLSDVASNGVWVSAHPDVIGKMGTKEVLYRTRELGWGPTPNCTRPFRSSVSGFHHVSRPGSHASSSNSAATAGTACGRWRSRQVPLTHPRMLRSS